MGKPPSLLRLRRSRGYAQDERKNLGSRQVPFVLSVARAKSKHERHDPKRLAIWYDLQSFITDGFKTQEAGYGTLTAFRNHLLIDPQPKEGE